MISGLGVPNVSGASDRRAIRLRLSTWLWTPPPGKSALAATGELRSAFSQPGTKLGHLPKPPTAWPAWRQTDRRRIANVAYGCSAQPGRGRQRNDFTGRTANARCAAVEIRPDRELRRRHRPPRDLQPDLHQPAAGEGAPAASSTSRPAASAPPRRSLIADIRTQPGLRLERLDDGRPPGLIRPHRPCRSRP